MTTFVTPLDYMMPETVASVLEKRFGFDLNAIFQFTILMWKHLDEADSQYHYQMAADELSRAFPQTLVLNYDQYMELAAYLIPVAQNIHGLLQANIRPVLEANNVSDLRYVGHVPGAVLMRIQ